MGIQAMSAKINALDTDILWQQQYCVNFDIQCDIPVLAGRSYGRAYYKIVITIHHDYLMHTDNISTMHAVDNEKSKNISHTHSEPAIMSTLKQPPNEDEPHMDLFKSLHNSIRRKQESVMQTPRTMSVVSGSYGSIQSKRNYVRTPTRMKQEQMSSSEVMNKSDVIEEDEEEEHKVEKSKDMMSASAYLQRPE